MKLFKKIRGVFSGKPFSKESRVARLHVLSGGGPVYSDENYETFCKESYLKNVIAFRCIHEIAKAAIEPSWELHRRLSDGESDLVTDHEINNILNRTSPTESWSKFVYKTVAYLLMTGNAFPERVLPVTRKGIYPVEMYSLRPDRIKLIPDKSGRIAKYEYATSTGKEYFEIDPITLKSDLLHISLFNPTNDFWGAPPIKPAARDIDISNEATDWNMSLIRNQGRPGMVFTLVGEMSDDDFSDFDRYLDEKFSGSSNVGKHIIITGDNGTKAEPYTMKMSDIEFMEGGRELARRIAMTLGYPPILLGIPGDSTYNNRKEARLEFYESTVMFYVNLFRHELNNWLFEPKDKLFLRCNWDDVAALEPRWETKWKRAQEADFLTVNEKRQLTGYDKTDGGDVVLVSAAMIPLLMAEQEVNLGLEEQAKKVSKDQDEFDLLMGFEDFRFEDESEEEFKTASLNSKGRSHARSLVSAGKVDKTSKWSFSAEDGNKILGDDNWVEYSKWFLGKDTSQDSKTKGHWKYPFGKNGKVYRSGVIAIKQRAAQQNDSTVEDAAANILNMIDKE